MENSNECNKFGLINYLIQSSSENNIMKLEDSYKYVFVTIEDIFESNIIDVKFINYFLEQISFKEFAINPIHNEYIHIINYPVILEIILKYIWEYDDIFCYEIPDKPNNVVIKFPYSEKNITILDDFCRNNFWAYNIYSEKKLPDENFKQIRLDIEQDNDNLVNFVEPENIVIDAQFINPIRFKFNTNRLYCKTYKPKCWINLFNEMINKNKMIRKLKNLKKWFRFKWYNILLPIYVINNNNVNEMLNYIWKRTNEYFKIKFTYDDILNLGLHPLQLIGNTSLILFRRNYSGNENILFNFKKFNKNSCINWTKISNIKVANTIVRNSIWNLSYLGNCGFQRELLNPILYLEDKLLTILNYPFNLASLNHYILTLNNTDQKLLQIYSEDENLESKSNFISDYIHII